MKLIGAGYRERNAFMKWWVNRVLVPYVPLWRSSEEATYDPVADTITWRDQTMAVQDIENRKDWRQYGDP